MAALRGLKQEIERLKSTLENPDYDDNAIIHPDKFSAFTELVGTWKKPKRP